MVSPERPTVEEADQREWKSRSFFCPSGNKAIHGIVVTDYFTDREFIAGALPTNASTENLPWAAESCHPAFGPF